MGKNKQKKKSEIREAKKLRAICSTLPMKYKYYPIGAWSRCTFCRSFKHKQYSTKSKERICRRCIVFKEQTEADWAMGLEAM